MLASVGDITPPIGVLSFSTYSSSLNLNKLFEVQFFKTFEKKSRVNPLNVDVVFGKHLPYLILDISFIGILVNNEVTSKLAIT